jgi:4'-phosphopantetheinyl transferase
MTLVAVWEVSLTAGAVDELEPLLSADERARARRFAFPRHRAAFVRGRAAVRGILAAYLDVEPAAVRFRYGERGKPELEPRGDLRFNVAHSDELALVAVTRGRDVGVDVERVDRERDRRVARRFFAASEHAAIEALPERERDLAFLRCWTAKEAYVKALGRGLSLPLDSFEVTVTPPVRLVRPAAEAAAAGIAIRGLDGIDRHVGAVAATGGEWWLERVAWRLPSAVAPRLGPADGEQQGELREYA